MQSARRSTLIVLATAVLLLNAACATGARTASNVSSTTAASAPTQTPTPVSSASSDTPTPRTAGTAVTALGPALVPALPLGPQISITRPAPGSTVQIPIEMSGTANTFEAALVVDALDSGGRQLCVRNIMATSGTGTPGRWETSLDFVPPSANQPVTLRAYDFSAKDGSIENLVQREVTLSAVHPAIYITSPTCGARVAPGTNVTVTGRAFVAEAMFTLELRGFFGDSVVIQQVTAESGTEESNFTASLAVPAGLPGGLYDLIAYDNSLKDGAVNHVFSVQLLVQ